MKKHFTRPQKTTIVQGIQSIVLIIAVLQLWLLTATMNSYLGGDQGVPVPAAIFSLICFAINRGPATIFVCARPHHGLERR